MKRFLYKSPDGHVFEFGSEEERNGWGAPDLIRMTQEEIDAHLSPQAPTYQQELAVINAAWQLKVESYNKAFALAALSDGPSEAAKKADIRAAYEADKAQNTADRAALKAKYGIGGV